MVEARSWNERVVEGLEPFLEPHWGKAELHVWFVVAFESVHRVLIEHFAVGVFEHGFLQPVAPAVGQVKPVQVPG